ncbi:hypothetical protein ACGFZK_29750 [Streptomyces sp. NPDC048257]|uniref:hypothetical protein n=1 Tax=Streptomyces sp. NPDC048257 TaxID=3365526 RepID=UPI00371C7E77
MSSVTQEVHSPQIPGPLPLADPAHCRPGRSISRPLVGVNFALPAGGDQGSFWAFFIGFLAAFAFSGLGNGSTFRQIPVIFRDQHMREAEGRGAEVQAAVLKQPQMEAGAVTGFSSAIAAYGFFFIPAMFAAMAVTNTLWLFIGFCATCLAVCWWFYARKGAEAPS